MWWMRKMCFAVSLVLEKMETERVCCNCEWLKAQYSEHVIRAHNPMYSIAESTSQPRGDQKNSGWMISQNGQGDQQCNVWPWPVTWTAMHESMISNPQQWDRSRHAKWELGTVSRTINNAIRFRQITNLLTNLLFNSLLKTLSPHFSFASSSLNDHHFWLGRSLHFCYFLICSVHLHNTDKSHMFAAIIHKK